MIGFRTYDKLKETVLANTGLTVVSEQWTRAGEQVIVRLGAGGRVLLTLTCATYDTPDNWHVGSLGQITIEELFRESEPRSQVFRGRVVGFTEWERLRQAVQVDLRERLEDSRLEVADDGFVYTDSSLTTESGRIEVDLDGSYRYTSVDAVKSVD